MSHFAFVWDEEHNDHWHLLREECVNTPHSWNPCKAAMPFSLHVCEETECVWGCGSHLRSHITEGEAWMQQSPSFLKVYHFPGWATRRWLSLGSNDFIFYHLRLRQIMAAGWGEPCKWWVQHVAFRTHCNVRDQSNLSQGSLHSAMQGLNNPVLWPSQSLSEPWKPRWTLPLVHYKMLPYLPQSHDVPQGKI